MVDNAPADSSDYLDNEIHPLFTADKWVMPNTPMPYDQLRPTLQLASKLITHERALQWFAHVKHGHYYTQGDAPPILLRNAGPLTEDMLEVAKLELLNLSNFLKLSWIGGAHGKRIYGLYCCDLDSVADVCSLPLIRYFGLPRAQIPTIVISVKLLKKAPQHSRQGATLVAQRVAQFQLASTLVHELAHAFTCFCHGGRRDYKEPLVFPTEALPEAGYSFNNFIFGAVVQSIAEETLFAADVASLYRKPRHVLITYVPQRWVHQWFLKSMWTNFSDLHERGALFAPSAAKQVEHVNVRRLCSTKRRGNCQMLVKGVLYDTKPCCRELACSGNRLGVLERYPSNPVDFLQVYLEALKANEKTAKRLGVEPLIDKGVKHGYMAQLLQMEACCRRDDAFEMVFAQAKKGVGKVVEPRGVRAWFNGFNGISGQP